MYLATVIDLFSGRLVGWSIAEHHRADLVRDALAAAVAARGGRVAGAIFHSDSEYVFYRMFPGLLTRTAMDGSVRAAQDVWCRDAPAAS